MLAMAGRRVDANKARRSSRAPAWASVGSGPAGVAGLGGVGRATAVLRGQAAGPLTREPGRCQGAGSLAISKPSPWEGLRFGAMRRFTFGFTARRLQFTS